MPWLSREQAAEAFHGLHAQRYGHRLDVPVELVNVRVALRASPPTMDLQRQAGADGAKPDPESYVAMYGVGEAIPSYARDSLSAGQSFSGPALLTETVATTYLAPGWRCQVDAYGNLLLERE